MSGLAVLARSLGHEVLGLDQEFRPPISEILQRNNITVKKGYDPEFIDEFNPDEILVGNVLNKTYPIVNYILQRSYKISSGPSWLYQNILFNKHVVAVTGTHGKTTTTAMITWILEQLGYEPSYLIGGNYKGATANARNSGDLFIIEADEYDSCFFDKRPKFLSYMPKTLVINNLEHDHIDIYKDLAAIKEQFNRLLQVIPDHSNVILNNDCPNVSSLALERLALIKVGSNGDYSFDQFALKPDHIPWPDNIIGEHNRYNAAVAIATVCSLGIHAKDAMQALSLFPGVERRLSIKEMKGVTFIDDFAHHPTSIEYSIKTVQEHFATKNIYINIELGSNTMRSGLHNTRLIKLLNGIKNLVLFAPKKVDFPLDSLSKAINARVFNKLSELKDYYEQSLSAGDLVLMLSNAGGNKLFAEL